MAIFATLNVGRNGISKSGAVKQLLDMCNATTCALQELDINRYSMCSWVADWRAKGFHALLSSPCFGFCRVGIVSTQPLKPIQLSEVDEPDRVVAAISEFELPDQQGVLKLIVCSVYCPVGDEDRAAKLALQVVTALAAWGFPFIVLGDFNTPQSSPGMIGILSPQVSLHWMNRLGLCLFFLQLGRIAQGVSTMGWVLATCFLSA